MKYGYFTFAIAILGALLPVLSMGSAVSQDLEHLGPERIVFHTNRGDIAVGLFPNAAPKHVAQILRLARAGVFNGVLINRVEAGFVAQTQSHFNRGTPLTQEQLALVKQIPAEFTSIQHRRGILSMARFADINSADTSFSFVLGRAKHLDGNYTAFGRVVSGISVLKAIEDMPVDSTSRPDDDVLIKSTTVFANGIPPEFSLEDVQPILYPDAPYHAFFKIFAAFAFFMTALLPFAKAVCGEYSLRFGVKAQKS